MRGEDIESLLGLRLPKRPHTKLQPKEATR
jgi:hypothetical protein